MDTIFRLVTTTLQSSSQSFNSSRTTTTSSSSKSQRHYEEEEEECFTIFMDDEDLYSSSYHLSHAPSSTTASPSNDVTLEFPTGQNPMWATAILSETAKSMVERNTPRLQKLIWMLNEMSSPYGDIDQKLASYFLQGLFCRMTDSGESNYRTMVSASERSSCFESTRKMVLRFQEVSPWMMFGHVACNGAIMEAFEGEMKLHIIDISNSFCTQWPTLLEAIATRSSSDTPHLTLTVVVPPTNSKVIREVGTRMEKFARLMGVPFKFNVKHHEGDLSSLDSSEFDVNESEALAINCVGTMHTIPPTRNRRDDLISTFRRLQPRIVTIVEEEVDLDISSDGPEFLEGFEKCLKWFRVYFEALDGSFPRVSNERLMLERGAGRAVVDLVACQPELSVERRDTAVGWTRRLHGGGFREFSFNEEVCDDVRSLLRKYKEGWTMSQSQDSAGIFLSWKDQAVVWASAWKP